MSDRSEDPPDIERVLADLSAAAHPIDVVDPGGGTMDLDPLLRALADADIIGLGEASHGTQEFFQFKAGLIRYLIEEQGLRLVGLEASFAAMLGVNRYVVNGEGSAEEALRHDAIHAVYQTETLLSLIEWLREFNADRNRADRVRFHGFDVQNAAPVATELRDLLAELEVDLPERVGTALERLATEGMPDVHDEAALRAHLDARECVVEGLDGTLTSLDSPASPGSANDQEVARRLVWVLDQGREQFQAIADGRASTGANVRIRDSAMAAQVQWLRHYTDGDRIALWGHNAHLARDAFAGGAIRHEQNIPSLGSNLARLSGVEYYSLGLVLGGGRVTAGYVPAAEFRAYEIGDPPEGSVPDVFGRVEAPAFFLSLADVDPESALGAWLASEPGQYDIAGGYEDSPVSLTASRYPAQFDGLVYVDASTPSRPLAGLGTDEAE